MQLDTQAFRYNEPLRKTPTLYPLLVIGDLGTQHLVRPSVGIASLASQLIIKRVVLISMYALNEPRRLANRSTYPAVCP